MGFPGGSDNKEFVCNGGDLGSIPGSGRSPGDVKGNPVQESCLELQRPEDPRGVQSKGSRLSRTRLSSTHTHTHAKHCSKSSEIQNC